MMRHDGYLWPLPDISSFLPLYLVSFWLLMYYHLMGVAPLISGNHCFIGVFEAAPPIIPRCLYVRSHGNVAPARSFSPEIIPVPVPGAEDPYVYVHTTNVIAA